MTAEDGLKAKLIYEAKRLRTDIGKIIDAKLDAEYATTFVAQSLLLLISDLNKEWQAGGQFLFINGTVDLIGKMEIAPVSIKGRSYSIADGDPTRVEGEVGEADLELARKLIANISSFTSFSVKEKTAATSTPQPTPQSSPTSSSP